MLKTVVFEGYLNIDQIKAIADVTDISHEEAMDEIYKLFLPTPDAVAVESLVGYISKKAVEGASSAFLGLSAFLYATRVQGILDSEQLGKDFGELFAQMKAYDGRGAMKVKLKLGIAELGFDSRTGEFYVIDFTYDVDLLEFEYGRNY